MNIMRPTLPSSVPGFLYKYTSVARALEVLLTGEVYFPHRRELNDPFDSRYIIDFSTPKKKEEAIKLVNQKFKEHEEKGHDLSGMLSEMNRKTYQQRLIKDDKFANNIVQKLVEDMDKSNTGVYCFAEREDSITMWAHYANNHQGCCLKFNFQEHICRSIKEGKDCFPFLVINMIRYCNKYPVHELGFHEEHSSYESKYWTKSEDWRYENEWRALMYDVEKLISSKSLDSKDIDDPIIKRMKGSGHYPLDKDLLHGIILGYKMKDNEKKSIINAALLSGIKIYEAQPKLYEYGMEIKPWGNFVLAK